MTKYTVEFSMEVAAKNPDDAAEKVARALRAEDGWRARFYVRSRSDRKAVDVDLGAVKQ